MDRGAWPAPVHGVTKNQMTDQWTVSLSTVVAAEVLEIFIYFLIVALFYSEIFWLFSDSQKSYFDTKYYK